MAEYIVQITARFVVETDNPREVSENYELPSFHYCDSVKSEPVYLDGSFTYEEKEK